MKPPPGFTLDTEPASPGTPSPPMGFTLDGAKPQRALVPRFPGGADLPGVADWMIQAITPPPGPAHAPFDPPVQTDWPHTPHDPGGLHFPPNTSLGAGIRSRAADLAKGFATTTDTLTRGPRQLQAGLDAEMAQSLFPGDSEMQRHMERRRFDASQPLPGVQAFEQIKKEIAYKPKITWAQVKQSSNPLDWARFILQEGVTSTPDMAGVLISTPTYIYARAGSLAEDRAKNDGRPEPTVNDLLVSFPTAIASGAMERIGTRGIFFGQGANAGQRIAKAGAKEAGTEAAQEGIEYTGTTAFTKKPFSPADMLDQMAAGAVVGGPMGSTARAGVEGVTSAYNAATASPPPNLGAIRSASDALSPYGPSAMSAPMMVPPAPAPVPPVPPMAPALPVPPLPSMTAQQMTPPVPPIPAPDAAFPSPGTPETVRPPFGFDLTSRPNLTPESLAPRTMAPAAPAAFPSQTIGEVPKRGLVVAARTRYGLVVYGKPGQVHSELTVTGQPLFKDPSNDMGWAGPDGKFLTREQALASLPPSHGVRSMPIAQQRGRLEAVEFNEIARQQRAQGASPLTIRRQDVIAQYTDAKGATDVTRAAEGITAQVDAALKAGQRVTLYSDGKPIEIVRVNRGMMADAKGQRWGLMSLYTAKDDSNRIEIGGARTTATGVPLRTSTGSAIPRPASGRVPSAPQPPAAPDAKTSRPAGAFTRADAESLAPERSPIFTPQGRRVEVSYQVVDLDQLVTSHDENLRPNAGYPSELQPRDRERAASAAQITEIAAMLEPERLGRSSDTSSGAPIVGPDLVVESGNGRALGLRKAYAEKPKKAAEYRAWLQGQGFDISRLDKPVLIARRVSKLSKEERVEFAREANAASTLRMSASETAKADAEIVRPILGQYKGGDVSFAQNAGFVRSFVNSLPASERGSLISANGEITQEGTRRIQGALLQAAYGDAALVAKVFESPSNDIRSIGGALLDVAPAWAQMVERVRRGEISKDVDRTKDLMTAVQSVEEARRKGMLVADVFNQGGLFGSVDTARDFAGMFFNDAAALKQPASRQVVAGRLRKYVEEAGKTSAGADMFGNKPASAKDILKATAGKVAPPEGFSLDEKGGSFTLSSGFDPTKPYQFYQRQAQKVLDFIHDKGGYTLAPLRNLSQEPEYLTHRYRALGKLAEVDKIAHKIFDAFRWASKADQRAVYAYMTTRGARPDAITSAKVRAHAVEAKGMIEDVGRRLVARGMLSQEVMEMHRGEYLPRTYLKHLLGPRFTSGRAKLDLGYLKKREDIPADTRRLILGEIVHPGYLAGRGFSVPMRDMVFQDFLEEIANHPEWVLRDSMVTWEGSEVSAAWLWAEAQRLRTMADHVELSADRDAINNMEAARREAVARPALGLDKVEGFRAVPDSPKYGKLRGVWLKEEIWNDLFGNLGFFVENPSFAERVLGQRGHISKATQIWKLLKVPFNPPTVFRNMVGNMMLLQMSGVPLVRLPDRIGQAITEALNNGRHWQIAKQHGVTSTNFAHAELYRLDRFARYALSKSDKPLVKLAAFLGGIADKASGFYGTVEAIFKTAKIIDAMEREGMSAEKAALEAHKWIFDYSLIPPTIRYLRNAPVGMPFVTFTYKVAPRLIEVAAKHPARLWPYVAAAFLLPALALEGLDISEEEYEALKKTMAKYMREKNHVFFLPWRDDHGRFQLVDVSAFMPWNFFTDVGQEAAKGDVGGTLYKSGFGGPFAQILVALESNIDPFTGREIVNKADPYSKRLWSAMIYAWRMMAPGWLTDQGAALKIHESLEGKVDKRTGDPLLTPSQAGARFFGVNITPIDPSIERAKEASRMSRELKDIQRRMGTVLFDRNLTKDQREAERQTYMRHYREKAQELQQYLRDTQKAPRVPRPTLPPGR